MITYSTIFNTETLNIFTDASIKKINKEYTVGCPGAVAIKTLDNGDTTFITEQIYLENNATNNSSEIKAIALGIDLALKYRPYYNKINLFSDSKICIYGLREWIFNWIYNTNNNIMYGSSGNPVFNQETFKSIINCIINNNLKINLFHQKGHVDNTKPASVKHAGEVFMQSNLVSGVDDNLIKCISDYNNYIDIRTKSALDTNTEWMKNNIIFKNKSIIHSVDSNAIDSCYKSLIGKR